MYVSALTVLVSAAFVLMIICFFGFFCWGRREEFDADGIVWVAVLPSGMGCLITEDQERRSDIKFKFPTEWLLPTERKQGWERRWYRTEFGSYWMSEAYNKAKLVKIRFQITIPNPLETWNACYVHLPQQKLKAFNWAQHITWIRRKKKTAHSVQ